MNSASQTRKDRDRINLRLSTETFALIDKARSARAGVISRNTWITEAIGEKLARELAKTEQMESKSARVL